MPDSLNILIVEDDRDFAESLEDLLTIDGHRVVIAPSCARGIEQARRRSFDVGFIDVKLGDGSGLDVIKVINDENLIRQCVIVTGHRAETFDDQARRLGAVGALQKPLNLNDIEKLLASAKAE